MFLHLEKLIRNILAHPGQSLEQLRITPAIERQKVIRKFNDTAADFPKEKTLSQKAFLQLTLQNQGQWPKLPTGIRQFLTAIVPYAAAKEYHSRKTSKIP